MSLRHIILGLAAALGAGAAHSATPARVEPQTCPVTVTGVSLRCGVLVAPLQRDAAGARVGDADVRLTYVVLPARDPAAGEDPVVFLTGGPGSSALAFLQNLADSPLRDRRDIIAVEERGNGYATPDLVCPTSAKDPVGACFAAVTARGVDLTAFDVTQSAHDLADLRTALGVANWNVVGVSWGTFWALHYVRLHPEGVRTLVLDSPVPAQAGLEDDTIAELNGVSRVLAACRASMLCDAAYPDLRARLHAMFKRYEANPRRAGGQTVDGSVLIRMTVGLTFESATVPFVPMFLDAVDKGDLAKAMKIADLDPYRFPKGFRLARAFATGVTFNMNCRDEAPFPAAAEARLHLDEAWPDGVARRLEDSDAAGLMEACQTWRVAPADPVVNAPVASDIPTLILVGAFDPVTPPERGRVLARTLSHATVAVVPEAAHAVLSWASPCVTAVAADFLAAPERAPDLTCLGAPSATHFKLPGDPIRLVPPLARPDTSRLQKVVDGLPGLGRSVPGAALSLSTRSGVSTVVAGPRSLSGPEPLSPDDGFRIASVTKTYVAAAALRLVEDGRLALDDTVADRASPETVQALTAAGYDPRGITVRHLLTHTSGLPDYAEASAFIAAVRANPAKVWTRADQIAIALKLRGPRGPGGRFEYSDTGYIIVGEMIERITGRRLGDAVAQLLDFRGLGLTSTRWEYRDAAPPTARTYYQGQDISAADPSLDLFGGGGLVSTTAEVARFYRALFEGRVLRDPASLVTMTTIPRGAAPDEDGSVYAMGLTTLNLGAETCWGHPGAWGVLGIYCPRADLALGLTVNAASPRGYANLGLMLRPFVDVR